MKRRTLNVGLVSLLTCCMMLTGNIFTNQKDKVFAAQQSMEPQVYKTGAYTLSNVNIRGGQGQSAVKIEGDVTLNIEGDVNLIGGDAYFKKELVREDHEKNSKESTKDYTYIPFGAGAGIEVPAGSTLTLKGSGTLHTRGGSAADGRDGVDALAGFHSGEIRNVLASSDDSSNGKHVYTDEYPVPKFAEGGQGGAGAGSGIGGKGADNASLTSSVGIVQIADKHLAVEANGGQGGYSAGKGGKGGSGNLRYAAVAINYYGVYLSTRGYATWLGAWGGQGGGGAGYPAAGIGSGGAAGGNGTNGQAGTSQNTRNKNDWFLTFPYWDSDYFNLNGGNGGNGGEGYVSGGGGGAGSLTEGWSQIYTLNGYGITGNANSVTLAPGGESGQDGGNSYPTSVKVKHIGSEGHEKNIYAGQPGRTAKGDRQGAKADGGTFVLNGGSVYSVGGGGQAQDIGSGDGLGANGGTVQIHGGDLTTKANAMATPTNGKEKVYPVTLRPKYYPSSADNTLKTNVKINDKDWNIGRFSLGNKEGVLHAYLPNGTYKVGVSNPEGIYDSNYDFDVKDQPIEPQSKDAQGLILDSSKGNIIFHNTYALQDGNRYTYGGTATITTSGNTGYNIDYDPDATAMQHKLILQNAKIKELNASKDPERYAKVNVEIQGKENAIQYITVFNAQSNVTFSGDENSNVDVTTIAGNPAWLADYGDNRRLEEQMYQITFNYISDVALAVNEYANKKGHKEIAVAANQLKAKGYTPLLRGNGDYVNLNAGTSGNAIAIGYKTTTDPEEALLDLWAGDGKYYKTLNDWSPLPALFSHKPLQNITGWPGNLDVNSGAGGDLIYLFKGAVSDYHKQFGEPYPSPMSTVGVYTQNDTGNHLDHTFYDSYAKQQYFDEKAHKFVYHDMDLNKGAGGNYIYLAYGNKLPVVKKDEKKYIANGSIDCNLNSPMWCGAGKPFDPTHAKLLDAPKIDSPDFHSGSIVMNSKGVVHVGDIYSYAHNTKGIAQTIHGERIDQKIEANIWGTPSLIVNSGYMKFDSYLKSKNGGKFWDMNWADLSIKSQGESWDLYNLIPTAFSKGNNKLGNIDVNSGTLQFGDGSGNIAIPQELSSLGTPRINVKSGGNLLSSSTPDVSEKTSLEISGLPKNEHLHSIKRSDSTTDNCGDYSNVDAWTNAYGNYRTYISKDDNGKRLVLADDTGNVYVYEIHNGQAQKVTLPQYSATGSSQAALRIEPKYKVQGDTLYDGTQTIDVKGDLPGGILLANQASLTIDNTDLRTIDSIHGNGNLRIGGVGVKVTKDITVPTNISNGSSEIHAMSAPLTMTGGSLKTSQPLQGVRNDKEEVYQCVLPIWDTNVKVDGKAYPVSGKSFDGKMYLYVPKSTKTIQAGTHTYATAFNNSGKIMNIREQKDGDGIIDIANGSAEILGNHLYTYQGELYINRNGDTYSLHGKSSENTLSITGGSADITFDNVDMKNTNSPISIKEGAKATLLMKGDVHLASTDASAIHVPKGAALTIKGSGHLTADSGNLAATIGGAMNETAGKVTIAGGTLDLQPTSNIAIGSGYGAATEEHSIVITGGSIYGDLGTTAVNAQQEALTRIIFEPKNVKDVKVEGKNYFVEQANMDGKLYLYVKTEEQKVVVGDTSYTAQPLKLKSLEHGSMELNVESDKGDVPLTDKDLVVEGTQVRVATKPDKGYGIKSGPAAGTYQVVKDGNDLKLTPINGFSDTMNLTKWDVANEKAKPKATNDKSVLNAYIQPLINLRLRSGENAMLPKKQNINGNDFSGLTKDIQNDKPETLDLGVANAGDAALTGDVKGAGITMEILINNKVVKTQKLSDQMQSVKYGWHTDGKDAVSVRFTGTGTITMTSMLLSNTVAVNSMDATFAPVVTLNITGQKDDYKLDDTPGVVRIFQKDGEALANDRNPSEPGFQCFEGEALQLMYIDPDGGSKFVSYTVTPKGEASKTITENPYVLKMDKDQSVDVKTKQDLYYEVVIPESVDLNNSSSQPQIKADVIKNLPAKQAIKVKISSGVMNGNTMLKRQGSDDTISIPTLWNGKNIPENGLLATFDKNTTAPMVAGELQFMTPKDMNLLAGKYQGTINFSISCEQESASK